MDGYCPGQSRSAGPITTTSTSLSHLPGISAATAEADA